MLDLFATMASYNTWMNAKVYGSAKELTAAELSANRGAFFGSVLGTLNHIAVGDRIWLLRFAEHSPANEALSEIRVLRKPQALDEVLFPDFDQLTEHRAMLDAVIERWARSLEESDLARVLCFTTLKGVRICKPFAGIVLHFFNHQTHHRGQVTTLLSQFGKDVGVTDLLTLLPNEE